jgi:hypothetical protein
MIEDTYYLISHVLNVRADEIISYEQEHRQKEVIAHGYDDKRKDSGSPCRSG